MKQAFKFSIQVTTMLGLMVPVSASAGVLSNIQAQCLCLTRHATLGQLISLGVMTALLMGIIALKWMYRHELNQAANKVKSEADHSATRALKELKIGARFSDGCQRWAEQKQ